MCANPRPELFWVLPESEIIQPGQSVSRFSSTTIWPEHSNNGDINLPAQVIDFCFRNRLIIGTVKEMDQKIFLIVRNEGETRNIKLDLRVSGFNPINPPVILILLLCLKEMFVLK